LERRPWWFPLHNYTQHFYFLSHAEDLSRRDTARKRHSHLVTLHGSVDTPVDPILFEDLITLTITLSNDGGVGFHHLPRKPVAKCLTPLSVSLLMIFAPFQDIVRVFKGSLRTRKTGAEFLTPLFSFLQFNPPLRSPSSFFATFHSFFRPFVPAFCSSSAHHFFSQSFLLIPVSSFFFFLPLPTSCLLVIRLSVLFLYDTLPTSATRVDERIHDRLLYFVLIMVSLGTHSGLLNTPIFPKFFSVPLAQCSRFFPIVST